MLHNIVFMYLSLSLQQLCNFDSTNFPSLPKGVVARKGIVGGVSSFQSSDRTSKDLLSGDWGQFQFEPEGVVEVRVAVVTNALRVTHASAPKV